MTSNVEKNTRGTQVSKIRVPPFYLPSSSSSPPSVCSPSARSPTQRLFVLLRRCRSKDQIFHPASVLLQPDRLPLFFEAPDRFPLPLFLFRSANHLLPLFFFVSGSGSGFMELEFHMDKLFHLSTPNLSFTDSKC